MDTKFYELIRNKVLDSITNKGSKGLLIWGFTEECIALLQELYSLGLNENIVSIVDSKDSFEGITLYDFKVISPLKLHEIQYDTLVITSDKNKEEILKRFIEVDSRKPRIIFAGISHMQFNDSVFYDIYESCIVKSYAGGYENSLIHIYQSLKYLAINKIYGSIAEFGMFKGGTLLFTKKVLEYYCNNKYRYFGFDTFEGFPEKKSALDLYSYKKCEYKHYGDVKKAFQNDFTIIKGDITETYKVLENEPLAFTFFDTDNYSSAKAAIQLCYQNTVKGGIIAFDHYITDEKYVETIGERIAAKEFFVDKNVLNLYGTGIFIKME